ncbi:MAG: histidine phosphatase family protein [Anaerolineae bacterium]|nr:histidine phosphatase family protein [Anaerolineae bacterium]
MSILFHPDTSKLTRLILVRHGRTLLNATGRIQGRADTPLDAQGRDEAHRAGARLRREFDVAALYTSPLRRCRETAAILGEHLDLIPQNNADIVEFSFGLIDGHTLEEVRERHPALGDALLHWLRVGQDSQEIRPRIPDAEDEAAFGARLAAFWDHIQAHHPGETVAAATHGGVIKGMLTLIAGGDLHRHMPFWADNGSLTVIDFYQKAGTIRLFNDRVHLEGPLTYGKALIL